MAARPHWDAGMLERRVTRDSARVGLLVFSAAAAVGFVAAIVPSPLAHPQLTMAGAIVAGVTIAVAVPVIRWPKLPLLATLVILYYTALALLVFGDYGQSEGLLALVAIPVVASALYGPRTLTVIALVAATAALVCYGAVNALNFSDEAQLLAVWPITGIGIAYAIHGLRYRLERTIADREQAIQRDAVLALIADELYSTFDGDQVIQLGLQSAARLTDLDGGPPSQAAFFLIEGDRATLIAAYAPDFKHRAWPRPSSRSPLSPPGVEHEAARSRGRRGPPPVHHRSNDAGSGCVWAGTRRARGGERDCAVGPGRRSRHRTPRRLQQQHRTQWVYRCAAGVAQEPCAAP